MKKPRSNEESQIPSEQFHADEDQIKSPDCDAPKSRNQFNKLDQETRKK